MLERSRAKMSGEHPTFAIPELRAYRWSSSDTDELDSSEAVDMPEMPVVEAHNSPIALKEIPNDEKLTGVENYEVWKATMTLNLQVLGLKEHYDGTVRRPAPGHPDEGKFDDDQAKTLCYIWGGLSLQMRQTLVRSGWTAKSTPQQTLYAIFKEVSAPAMVQTPLTPDEESDPAARRQRALEAENFCLRARQEKLRAVIVLDASSPRR